VSHRVDDCLVVELHEPVDPETEHVTEYEVDRLIRAADVRRVVIDIHTPLVTTTALHILLRARERAGIRGVGFHVVARQSLARRVFRLTHLSRVLRVTATMSAVAAASGRDCPPSHTGDVRPRARSAVSRRDGHPLHL